MLKGNQIPHGSWSVLLAGQLLSHPAGFSAALASIPSLHIQVQANKKSQSYSSDNILKHVI